MFKFSVMDLSGHSELAFSAVEREAAERKFAELLKKGHTAAARGAGAGEYTLVKKLPEDAAEVLFVPQLQGG